MPIRVTCEGCKKSFAVKDRFAGKRGICPHCGGSIAVPEAPAEAAALTEKVKAGAGESGIHASAGGPDSGSAVSLAVATEIPKKACPKCTRLNLAASMNCFYCGASFPDAFDPYYKWLGIPRQDQPPHHYRLLGLTLYETDSDVIQEAADQRMAHVRTHQNGPHAVASQRILNEISTAKVCLLNADKRAAYDVTLRARLAPISAKVAPMPMGIPIGARPAGVPTAMPAPANPMDQILPPTVWSSPPGYSPQAFPGQPGHPFGAPMAPMPGAMGPMPGGPLPGPMPGMLAPGTGLPMPGMMSGAPQLGPQGMPMAGIPMARPAQPSGPSVSVTTTPRPRSNDSTLIQGIIAVVVTLAIMGVAGYFLSH